MSDHARSCENKPKQAKTSPNNPLAGLKNLFLFFCYVLSSIVRFKTDRILRPPQKSCLIRPRSHVGPKFLVFLRKSFVFLRKSLAFPTEILGFFKVFLGFPKEFLGFSKVFLGFSNEILCLSMEILSLSKETFGFSEGIFGFSEEILKATGPNPGLRNFLHSSQLNLN